MAEGQSFPLVAPDPLYHHDRPFLAHVGLGQVAGAVGTCRLEERHFSSWRHLSLRSCCHFWDIPDQVEFS